jgi:hypothetical protein
LHAISCDLTGVFRIIISCFVWTRAIANSGSGSVA